MPLRSSLLAGQFYPSDAQELRDSIAAYFRGAAQQSYPAFHPSRSPTASAEIFATLLPPLLTLVPHAGHVYCGHVVAQTLASLTLAPTMIILAPSHSGNGHPMGFWPDGAWRTPLGDVSVNATLGLELAALDGGFAPDTLPHKHEHDIEVILPFLQYLRPDIQILPIVIGQPDRWETMQAAAMALAELGKRHGVGQASPDIGFLLSSDMNHFASDAENRRKDALALEAFLALDPMMLWNTVQHNSISMCGIIPAVISLLACQAWGASRSQLVAYDTSASVSGDSSRVVGYAGAHVW